MKYKFLLVIWGLLSRIAAHIVTSVSEDMHSFGVALQRDREPFGAQKNCTFTANERGQEMSSICWRSGPISRL